MGSAKIAMSESDKSPLLYLDEIQVDIYRLLTLFYSGLGIVQRDSPVASSEQEASPDEVLRLENNIQEIIGQFNVTKERVLSRVSALEQMPVDEGKIERLLQESRELDELLKKKIEEFELELPLLKNQVDGLVDEMSEL
ncbi:hypothetical protein NEHOM01_1315 [Nematocida homosporus]|uniref:uncharacterized protein n=1 Tax=Nematocida homosporus TaxID=1912981 RepID=UPI0022211196|nr:uncharacterized protein NEHOM01_1315 [Nematocida homosporus]KAI5186150.1 hypothetical protein NEHOM01_1315 [Nematocida homosporus]